MKKSKRVLLLIVILLLISSVAFSASSRIDDGYMNGFYLFMSNMYYREIAVDDLLGGSLNGILKDASVFSCYESRQESEQTPVMSFGATFEKIRSGLLVSNVYIGSMAAKAGIETGDIIFQINRINSSLLNANDFDYVLELAGGKAEIKVIKGKSGEVVTIEATLDQCYVSAVDFFISDDIGYIRINRFIEESSLEVGKALAYFDHSSVDTIILDVRDTISMNIKEACEIADYFLLYGRIASGKEQVYSATFKNDAHRVNVVINEMTYGGGEVIARAISNYGRGMVYGEASKGFAELIATYPVFTDDGYLLYSEMAGTTDIDLITRYIDNHEIMINKEYIAGYLHIDEGLLLDDQNQSYEKGITPDFNVEGTRETDRELSNGSSIWIRKDYVVGDLSYDIYIAEKILMELGFFHQKPDVTFDEDTKEAVNAYKASIHYEEDGVLDMTTQNLLNYDVYKVNIIDDECIENVITLIKENNHE